jgi:predicted phage baseplate assembly protein
LDAEVGTLLFGNGRIGRVPSADAEISVTYQTGGGASGNVAAEMLVQLAPNQPTVKVEQPFAACGGVAAETLTEAKGRAVREFATPTRAVTVQDFEALALETPGVPLARAHAIPDYHPAMHCISVSGSTTVVVLPPCPEERPEPSEALLRMVRQYLERRRVLTSEIHVVGPHYSTVSIRAHLQIRPEVDRRALISEAQRALDRWFHPLKGGPDGQGWPIGRAVYRAELLALLNDLQGVLYVEDLTWRLDDQPASRCGNITICPHGLIASGLHEMTVNEGSGCHE